MPKLPSKESAATALQRDVDSLDVIDVEGDCLSFERRLNDWIDLRSDADDISHDAHLLSCARCKMMLDNYQTVFEASKLIGVLHGDDGVDQDALAVVGRASLDRLPDDSARSQFFGWSTLLAVLFVFWGASAGIPTDVSLTERVSPTSLQTDPSEFVNGMSFAMLSEYPSDLAGHLVAANPLVQNAPVSCQSFLEMPAGRLLAAGLPVVDFDLVDLGQLNHLGRYWQHASRLPGIEPWQHSVNFAIGWLNQPALPDGKPQCG